VLLTAAAADAGDRPGWRARRAEAAPCCAVPQARFPRLAAIAQPPSFMLPGYTFPRLGNRPAISYGLSIAFAVMAFFDPPFTAIGFGVMPTVRAAHVLLNGSPTPGRPLVTAGWVANPYVIEALMWLRMRRTGEVPGIDYPVNPPLNGYNTPRLIQGAMPTQDYWATVP
jgi:hypothetical protein